jgi:hypothetical protein
MANCTIAIVYAKHPVLWSDPTVPANQREVQFCTLLQVSVRLYGDSTNTSPARSYL